MPATHEVTNRLVREAVLEDHGPTLRHRLTRRLGGALVQDSRGITRFLQVHSEVDHVDDDLSVRLGLGRPTHHPKAHVGLPVPGHEGRDDGVKRPLVGFVGIELPLLQSEQLSTILEYESQAIR